MTAEDLAGYLDAFGTPIRVKGEDYVGIVDDDYENVELGRVRIASNAPQVLITKADERRMTLALNDTVAIYSDETDTWSDYLVRSIQARTDGFVALRVIETT